MQVRGGGVACDAGRVTVTCAGVDVAGLTRCSRELSGAVTALMQAGAAGGQRADIVDKKNNEFLRCVAPRVAWQTPHTLPAGRW